MSNSRWQCSQCKSEEVQIALPAWHTESKDYTVTYVETDLEASIMWWYCANCGETGHGNPEEAA